MLIHLCELLVIVVLLAVLGFGRRRGSIHDRQGFRPDTYRESAQARIHVSETRIRDLERSLDKMRERARTRDYIIFHLWRRNSRELFTRLWWRVYVIAGGFLLRLPWPSSATRQMLGASILAVGIMGAVLNMVPGAAPHRIHSPRSQTPTMLRVEVGEAVMDARTLDWMVGWQCHGPAFRPLVESTRLTITACHILPRLERPEMMIDPPDIILRDERDRIAWYAFVRHEPTTVIVYALN